MTPNKAMKRTSLPVTFSAYAEKVARRRRPLIAALGVIGMNYSRLNDWLVLLANVGVVVGLVLLIFEIRQNSEMMRAQITQSRAEASMSLASDYYNSDYLPAIYEKLRHGESTTPEEESRFRVYLRASLRNQENNYLQHLDGYLGDHIPGNSAQAVRSILQVEFARRYWSDHRAIFDSEFARFVDEALAEPISGGGKTHNDA